MLKALGFVLAVVFAFPLSAEAKPKCLKEARQCAKAAKKDGWEHAKCGVDMHKCITKAKAEGMKKAVCLADCEAIRVPFHHNCVAVAEHGNPGMPKCNGLADCIKKSTGKVKDTLEKCQKATKEHVKGCKDICKE